MKLVRGKNKRMDLKITNPTSIHVHHKWQIIVDYALSHKPHLTTSFLLSHFVAIAIVPTNIFNREAHKPIIFTT
jgi:hypothetical protein